PFALEIDAVLLREAQEADRILPAIGHALRALAHQRLKLLIEHLVGEERVGRERLRVRRATRKEAGELRRRAGIAVPARIGNEAALLRGPDYAGRIVSISDGRGAFSIRHLVHP